MAETHIQSVEDQENNRERESLIATAVNFLHNDNVRRSPLSQKQKFLRSKGLTENEIQIAFERAGVFSNDPNTVINLGINSSQAQHSKNLVVHQLQVPTTFTKIKDFLNSAAIISGIIYAIYKFYKNYIEPFLFGRKKKTVEEQLSEIDNKVDTGISKLSTEVIKIREDISCNNQNDILRELSNFKNDLEAIKGLLLNRKQFANPFPIPAWQLQSTQHHQADKNDDADGSGSGSSETEAVIKNSDSSIEIM
ncbi:peroxisomal membrane protein PEX14 [Condylostylus longicornis]|uniref:peroxisomal membrane protein PEX14 n=1 Tax=Condylostylus longicornis TaxID=2530218 RepID=UPI00244E5A93|nr:peroxisomal membrane protein PEX14 [Condylostylus longicornis]